MHLSCAANSGLRYAEQANAKYETIRPVHLLFARAILEVITASLVCIIFVTILYVFDYDIMPVNPSTAAMALFATVYFGVGYGFFGLIIMALFGPYAMIVIVLSMVGLYIASGVYLSAVSYVGNRVAISILQPNFQLFRLDAICILFKL